MPFVYLFLIYIKTKYTNDIVYIFIKRRLTQYYQGKNTIDISSKRCYIENIDYILIQMLLFN